MSRPIQAIIVDDEPLGRERIRMLLEDFPSVSVVAECDGGESAVTAVRRHHPDLLFLDIQMPDLDGFGVVTRLREEVAVLPIIIFVTAFSQHAVKAFEVNAIDYLLKPVQATRLGAALERVESLLAKPAAEDWQQRLFKALGTADKTVYWQRIEVRSVGKTEFVPTDDIFWFKADGNYIELHTADRSHLARITMAELEKQLDPTCFLRVSRSSFVNIKRVRCIQSDGVRGHVILLTDGRKVPAKRSLDELQVLLKYLTP